MSQVEELPPIWGVELAHMGMRDDDGVRWECSASIDDGIVAVCCQELHEDAIAGGTTIRMPLALFRAVVKRALDKMPAETEEV